jgi:hypothetical protein
MRGAVPNLIRLHYIGYSMRLMFSCNLRIPYITQRDGGRSVDQHVCVVLLYSGIVEYRVAVSMATADTALDTV